MVIWTLQLSKRSFFYHPQPQVTQSSPEILQPVLFTSTHPSLLNIYLNQINKNQVLLKTKLWYIKINKGEKSKEKLIFMNNFDFVFIFNWTLDYYPLFLIIIFTLLVSCIWQTHIRGRHNYERWKETFRPIL